MIEVTKQEYSNLAKSIILKFFSHSGLFFKQVTAWLLLHFKEIVQELFAVLCLLLFIFSLKKVGKEERLNVRKTVSFKYFLRLCLFFPKFLADQGVAYTRLHRNGKSIFCRCVPNCLLFLLVIKVESGGGVCSNKTKK